MSGRQRPWEIVRGEPVVSEHRAGVKRGDIAIDDPALKRLGEQPMQTGPLAGNQVVMDGRASERVAKAVSAS